MFPDPRAADADGLLASGGDLEPATLVDAYRQGIFPWPLVEQVMLWWSPDPRAVFVPDGVRVSRRLARTLRQGRVRVTLDAAFDDVVAGCAARPETWITPAMRAAYGRLHALGWAHSVEVWDAGDVLAGGLYGVVVGACFSAESMFSRARDASKIALVALAQHARRVGITLIDAQVPSAHLASLGAVEMPRAAFLEALARAVRERVAF